MINCLAELGTAEAETTVPEVTQEGSSYKILVPVVLPLLPLPAGFIQTCVNCLLQVYAQLDFDNASRSSCAVLFSIAASPLGSFYISKSAEEHISYIYRAPSQGSGESQDTGSTHCCASM